MEKYQNLLTTLCDFCDIKFVYRTLFLTISIYCYKLENLDDNWKLLETYDYCTHTHVMILLLTVYIQTDDSMYDAHLDCFTVACDLLSFYCWHCWHMMQRAWCYAYVLCNSGPGKGFCVQKMDECGWKMMDDCRIGQAKTTSWLSSASYYSVEQWEIFRD